MKRIICVVLALVMCLGLFAACGQTAPTPTNPQTPTTNNGGETPNPLAGTYDITMWVSEKEGVADLFKTQIKAFMDANPGIVINAQIEGVSEADAGSKVIADVASAPDIYCFAQDQLARLVQEIGRASCRERV